MRVVQARVSWLKLLLNQLIHDISVHEAVEELHVYPIIKDRLQNGHTLMERGLKEHRKAKRTLVKLDDFSSSLKDTTTEWPEIVVHRLEKLKAILKTHIDFEEKTLFPELQHILTQDELVQLGRTLDNAKHHVPTRPHLKISDQPPLASVVYPVAGVADKMRDKSRSFPTTAK